MQVVLVKFTEGYSEKNYNYMFDGVALEKGEHVVVDSPYGGYKVAVVVSVVADPLGTSKATKWIVCKVDDAEYKERTLRLQRKAELEKALKQSMEKAMAKMQFEQMTQYMSEEDKALFEEYKNL